MIKDQGLTRRSAGIPGTANPMAVGLFWRPPRRLQTGHKIPGPSRLTLEVTSRANVGNDPRQQKRRRQMKTAIFKIEGCDACANNDQTPR